MFTFYLDELNRAVASLAEEAQRGRERAVVSQTERKRKQMVRKWTQQWINSWSAVNFSQCINVFLGLILVRQLLWKGWNWHLMFLLRFVLCSYFIISNLLVIFFFLLIIFLHSPWCIWSNFSQILWWRWVLRKLRDFFF